jgi:hypothetical protein
MQLKTIVIACLSLVLLTTVGCSGTTGGQSYNFTAATNVALGLKSRRDESRTTGPTLCSSVICVSPTALTGKYYGAGLLIQSSGSGMVAYFGQESWSQITGASTSLPFDSASPVTNAGNLTCCGGTGNLASSSAYISDVIYLFGYLDATFALTGITSNTNMNRTFTVRFVLADGAISGGVRGDLLLKDPADSVFKWINTATSAGGDVGAGTLVTSRPTSPVTMNSSVTAYTNPFGTTQGNQTIPVIYAPVIPASGGVYTISEAELSTSSRTYTFRFDPTNFVMFPSLQSATDLNMLSTYTSMLQRIHLGGLPFSTQPQGVGSPASTELTVTGS